MLDMLERSLAPMQAHSNETIVAYLLMLDTCILMLANLRKVMMYTLEVIVILL